MIGNGELMHERFPKHFRMETTRMTYGRETEEEGENRRVNMKRSTAGRKKMLLIVALAYHPQGLLLPETMDELPDEPNLQL